jgi:hypothetical protein
VVLSRREALRARKSGAVTFLMTFELFMTVVVAASFPGSAPFYLNA